MRPSALAPLVLLAVLAAAATACGGPILFADVEVPRICFTEKTLAIPGSPAGGDVSSPRFSVDLTNQIPLLRLNSADTDLRVDEVRITPVSGSPDLSGITTAVVQALPASGAAVDVVRYQRTPAAAPPSELVLDGDTVNLQPYLVSGQAQLRFTLSGQPPSATWTADVTTCLHGQARVSP